MGTIHIRFTVLTIEEEYFYLYNDYTDKSIGEIKLPLASSEQYPPENSKDNETRTYDESKSFS
ncbi:MAG: hypothetical protein JXQ67_00425 [Campylobacterales bacterium]|nr:hypothetical protein [Campylobacterales bacterium]